MYFIFFLNYADAAEMGTTVICEMLHRTNLIAIVGGGPRPKYADNTILVYDDVMKNFVLDYTFTSPVVAVRLKRDRWCIGITGRFLFPFKGIISSVILG